MKPPPPPPPPPPARSCCLDRGGVEGAVANRQSSALPLLSLDTHSWEPLCWLMCPLLWLAERTRKRARLACTFARPPAVGLLLVVVEEEVTASAPLPATASPAAAGCAEALDMGTVSRGPTGPLSSCGLSCQRWQPAAWDSSHHSAGRPSHRCAFVVTITQQSCCQACCFCCCCCLQRSPLCCNHARYSFRNHVAWCVLEQEERRALADFETALVCWFGCGDLPS